MRQMKPVRLLIAAVALLLLQCVPGLRAEQGEIIKELSVANAERILEALKLEYSEVRPGLYNFKMAGYNVRFLNNGKNLKFYASFTRKVTFGRINEWNMTKRYSRAYLDKDGDPTLEADLDIEGGVSYGAIAEFFKTWLISVKLFAQHIDFK